MDDKECLDEVPTDLSRCLLGIALPVERDDYRIAFNGGSYSDFVRLNRGSGSEEVLWRTHYEQTAGELSELIKVARDLGVEVRYPFKLNDFCDLGRYQVVTLFAHWRGFKLKPADVDVPTLIKRLDGCDDSIARKLKKYTSPCPDGGINLDLSSLNKALESELFFPFDEGNGVAQAFLPVELRTRNREALDNWCPECFVPGNRLELYDGLHDIESINNMIDPLFEGVLHFAVCDSVLLNNVQNKNSRKVVYDTKLDIFLAAKLQKYLYRGISQDPSSNYVNLFYDFVEKIKTTVMKKTADRSFLNSIKNLLRFW